MIFYYVFPIVGYLLARRAEFAFYSVVRMTTMKAFTAGINFLVFFNFLCVKLALLRLGLSTN